MLSQSSISHITPGQTPASHFCASRYKDNKKFLGCRSFISLQLPPHLRLTSSLPRNTHIIAAPQFFSTPQLPTYTSNMIATKTLLALAAAKAATAHFGLVFPEWRADTLSEEGEAVYSQWNNPCTLPLAHNLPHHRPSR